MEDGGRPPGNGLPDQVSNPAHAPDEFCPIDRLAKAAVFFACFPGLYCERRGKSGTGQQYPSRATRGSSGGRAGDC